MLLNLGLETNQDLEEDNTPAANLKLLSKKCKWESQLLSRWAWVRNRNQEY